MKSSVLVLSLFLFVYRESVHMPAKKKKDPFCRSGKRASRKDQDCTSFYYESGNSSRSRETPSWKKAIKDHIIRKPSSDRKNLMSG